MRKLAKTKSHGERTFILSDTTSQLKLYQDIWYNKKGVVDEEHSYILLFFIYDTLLARKKHIISCSDTTITKITYDFFSVWDWEPENYKMTGSFEILELSDKKTTIRENITVNDIFGKKTLYFNGLKTYSVNPNWK